MDTETTAQHPLVSRRIPVIALLVASTVVNVLLAAKVTSLRSVITYMKSEHSLKVGTVVSKIEARALDGSTKAIRYDDVQVPTILYVFTPTCGWCAKNLENVRTMERNTAGRYRLVGVSLSQTNLKEYLQREGLTFPTYTDINARSKEELHLGGTPQTIIVSPAGVVTHTWTGAFDGEQKAAVEKALAIHLPGLVVTKAHL